jgi:hypothetical protein
MDEENLYDEFGNYIGPEIDENVTKTIDRSNPFGDNIVSMEYCIDLCLNSAGG